MKCECGAKMCKYEQYKCGDMYAKWECGKVVENGLLIIECLNKKKRRRKK